MDRREGKSQPASAGVAGNDADSAPRTYIINGFNDHWLEALTSAGTSGDILSQMVNRAMKDTLVSAPSDTVLFGEKFYSSGHFFMDVLEPGLGPKGEVGGNQETQLNQSLHGKAANTKGAGGSNYAMVDGSSRYIKYGGTFAPEDLWATTTGWRTNTLGY